MHDRTASLITFNPEIKSPGRLKPLADPAKGVVASPGRRTIDMLPPLWMCQENQELLHLGGWMIPETTTGKEIKAGCTPAR